MGVSELAAYAAIATVFVTIVRDAVNGAWRLGSRFTAFEQKITATIQGHKKEEAEALSRFEAEVDNRVRDLTAHLREAENKIHEVETWARDEFVRKQSFGEVIARMERVMDNLDQWLRQIQAQRNNRPPTG